MASKSADSANSGLRDGIIRFLRDHPPFMQMDTDDLNYLAGHLVLGYYPRQTCITEPGEIPLQTLYIVQRGMVQVQPHVPDRNGGLQPQCMGAGECFSISALLEKRAVTEPYIAAADTFCYELPAEQFNVLIDRSAVFREHATALLASLLRESRRVIKMNAASAVEDLQIMSRPLRTLVARKPVSCHPETPLGAALRIMQTGKVGSILIVDDAHVLQGILTRHDLLDRVALAGADLSSPVANFMTAQPLRLQADASAHEAAVLIAERGIRHVPVCDGSRLLGVVTERDLFALQRGGVRSTRRSISDACDVNGLRRAAGEIRLLLHGMQDQGLSAEHMTQIISTLNDALTQRLLTLLQKEYGIDDIRWCWLALGSEGRFEQTISTDQDNGLVFAADAEPEALRRRLLPFATAVNDALDVCGFPLCKGGIMASNPHWCLSLEEWQRQFERWVENTDPEALLKSVIFFDFRGLHGDMQLAVALREYLQRLAAGSKLFQQTLARYALETRPPLGFLNDFLTEDVDGAPGSIDLKKSGARIFTDCARVMALAAGVTSTNTVQRLRAAGPMLNVPDAEIASMVDAFHFLQALRLRSQTTASGMTPNRINPRKLHEVDRRILKESLRQAAKLQSRLALDYQL